MSEFQDIRTQLNQIRSEAEQVQLDLFVARQKLQQIEAEQAQLERQFDPANKSHASQRRKLAEASRATAAAIESLGQKQASLSADVAGLWQSFSPLADPRTRISEFDARFPILLFPVRLETRFKTVTIRGGQVPQLWVRVYPDDCLIDAFEPTPSQTEIGNTRLYWAGIWKAGGDDGLERGAWRSLASSHGPGRAAYLIEQYQPDAIATSPRPVRLDEGEIILVIPTEAPLPAAEQAALHTYWIAAWRAGDDAAALQSAFGSLSATLGEEKAKAYIETYPPFNIPEQPAAGIGRNEAIVKAVTVVFPKNEDTPSKNAAWTQAAKVNLLPERFVLLGDSGAEHIEVLGNPVTSPLIVSPDPLEKKDKQFQLDEDGNLVAPEYLQWMTDFEAALQAGMGFRINLTPQQAANGFDRLQVLGVRLSADEWEGKNLLEGLLAHHQQSSRGLAVIPQGAPTNNTEEETAGYSRSTDADATFDILKKIETDGSQFNESEANPLRKQDGLWLAEHLGIDPAVLQKTPHAAGVDQCEARAMNAALFPATLGYWMDTQMQPVFEDETIQRTRDFFNRFVSGRGAVPAIRIGKQPYGILPASNFSQLGWLNPQESNLAVLINRNPELEFLRRLYVVLRELDELFWKNWAAGAPHTGQSTDNPQQLLLDIVGQHPASVEYYQQWAESLDHIWNKLKISYFVDWTAFWPKVMNLLIGGPQLLAQFGYEGNPPEILEKIFLEKPNILKGPVVDKDPPLSETETLSAVTPDGKNYIEWLIDKASTNMDDLRAQRGFADKAPTALLYQKLKLALELGYYDLSLQLHREADLLNGEALRALRREPAFIHVAEKPPASESRYQLLYKAEARITGNQTQSIAQYIPSVLHELALARYLREQIEALKHLVKTPTARLERLFAEHIDCCSYRWDAWMLGLAHFRLDQMRSATAIEGEENTGKGIYLGAYGWVENLKPDHSFLSPVEGLAEDLQEIFNAKGEAPLVRDNQNGGYVHAPSLNHAVTAAVLRNGYLHNATPSEPGLLAVNLSSGRVRQAMQFIEGIRNGQSLGALLGYQFERGLHDRYNEAEVDQFIFSIRQAFPLRAKRITTTQPADDEPIEKIEARNVVDGLRLLDHVKANAVKTYPWGKNLRRGSAAQESIINAEVSRLLNIHDAIADLAVAESVHQAVQGNYDRAAASLDAYSRANFPPNPDVAATPRSGVTLTHRVGLQLPIAPMAGTTPRSTAEPALNEWLSNVLPPMADIVARVAFQNPATGVWQEDKIVSWQDLGLSPLDLLYILNTDSDQAMNEVDDRICHFVLQEQALRPDAEVQLRYTEAVPGKFTFFEIQALAASLRALLLQSRPLKPGDVAMPNEAKSEAEGDIVAPEARITAVRARQGILHTTAIKLAVDLEPLAALDPAIATEPEISDMLNQFEGLFQRFVNLQMEAGQFGIALSGFGWAMNTRKQLFGGIIQKAKELSGRWADQQAKYTQLVTDSQVAGLTIAEQFELLQKAEQAISVSATLPLPPSPDAYRLLLSGKKAAFDTGLALVNAIPGTASSSFKALTAEWEALLPAIASHDLTPYDMTEEKKQLFVFLQDMLVQTKGLGGELKKRQDAADEKITLSGATQGEKKAQALADAAKYLLGDGFRIVPQFTLRAPQADEWQNAWDNRALLTAYLEGEGVDFPVDDWLYGIARVRTKMHDWENVVQLSGAFGQPEPVLTPLQFPFKAGEPWLALDYPDTLDAQTTGDRLLYTAVYGGGVFSKNTNQCGLLLDEWTEVLPGKEETTGLAFHYDRPNNEPPQTLLLAIPSTTGEHWAWDDLTAAVRETFELAKKRAAEPRNVEQTALARFLPATIAAVTFRGISISNNLAVNNNFSTLLKID